MRKARSAAARLRVRPPAGSVMFPALGGVMVIALGWASPGEPAVNPPTIEVPAVAEPHGMMTGARVAVPSSLTRVDVTDERVDAGTDGTAVTEESELPAQIACVLPRLPAETGMHLAVTVLTDPDIVPAALLAVVRQGAVLVASRDLQGTPGVVTAELPVTEEPGLVLEVHGARFSVTSADDLPAPLAAVPRGQWQVKEHGLAATVDLRALLQPIGVRVTSSEGAETVMLYCRGQGEAKWAPVRPTRHPPLAVRRGSGIEVVAMTRGLHARDWLRPGENTMVLGEPTEVRIGVQGVPREMPSWRVQMSLCLLSRREPGLDGVVPMTDASSPACAEDALRFALERAVGTMVITNGAGILEAPCRGSYLALPILHVGNAAVPLLDAAQPVEVTTAGDNVAVNIHIDPARAQAALR